MTRSGRDRLAVLVAGATEAEAFSAARTAPTAGLQLEVRGVGPIKLPVSQAQARQLCLLGRPARYGRGEQTLLDRGIRDTWEIPKSRVKIDRRRWDQTLLPVLDRLGHDLGLPSGGMLRAELHSMLVYARGQFFVEHQDSEKDDAMVDRLAAGDSLVVPALWPLEVANALTVLRRRRNLTPDEARISIEIIRELPAVIDHEAAAIAFTRLVDLASEHDLTVYDATYTKRRRADNCPLRRTTRG